MIDDKIRILIVEDEGAVLQSLFNIISRRYSSVYTALNAQKALSIFQSEEIDLVLTDIRMPGMDGITMLRKMTAEKPDLRGLVMSAYSESEYFMQSIDIGVDGYILKPFLKEKILEAIEKSAKYIRMERLVEYSQKKLYESEKKLRELNHTKDKFFSIIGHDLRTPVSIIAQYSGLLIDDFDEMKKKEVLDIVNIIQDSSLRALDLLKNLLNWAKIQTGSFAYKPEIINIYHTIDEEVEFAASLWGKKNITLSYTPKPNDFVYADKNMFRTIIRNLLSNAIKFTPPKGTIRLFSEPINAGSDLIKISIQDSGVGIPPKILLKLFKLNHNYSSEDTNGEIGTGMGLLFCKEFIDIQGGTIQAESIEGKGSTFSFSLPTIEKKQLG